MAERYTDTDVELVADLLEDRIQSLGMTFQAAAAELLNQLTADGWQPIHRAIGYTDVAGRCHHPADITIVYPDDNR